MEKYLFLQYEIEGKIVGNFEYILIKFTQIPLKVELIKYEGIC